MATRSRIGKLNEDGTITSIYCHWDGYHEHVGVTLANYYKYVDKVNTLLSMGNLFSLAPDIGDFNITNNDSKLFCIFYARDHENETDENMILHATEYEYLKTARDCDAEFAYLYKDYEWLCKDLNKDYLDWQNII